ncbi:MAG: hypothetical protein N3E48_00085 [Candidatus Bathyarchaeota archaeon]|nr:hypothetical protein [Candidatus Bathyarchaeota archaeon]
MSKKLLIVGFPKLRKSYVKVGSWIKSIRYKALFLEFPRLLTDAVRSLGEGLPYNYVLSEVKKQGLIPEPVGSWEYYAEPILKSIPQAKQNNPNMDIYCYRSSAYEKFSADMAVKITLLTLRSIITGKVDVREWKKILIEELRFSFKALEEEVEYITEVAKNYDANVCLSGLAAKNIENLTRKEGFDVEVKYFDTPYYYTPLEVLRNKLKEELEEGRENPDHVFENLIKQHIYYIKNYILLSINPDDAYDKWLKTEAKKLEEIAEKDKTVFTGYGSGDDKLGC